MRQHKSTLKKNLDDFLKRSDFTELYNTWNISEWRSTYVPDRIRKFEDDPENPYEKMEVTPLHKTQIIDFKLKCVNHKNFDFYIYEDYENKDLIYFKPAVYYYGNYIKDYVYYLIAGGELYAPFEQYCRNLAQQSDNFAMHNYKIDMETVEKFNLMR